jgi:two-component system, response regulator, stage 0 sporulation protein F
MMSESLMDIKQTAAYLKMNKMTVYKLAREDRIPAFKIASEWRFKKEIIDQWLINQLKQKPDFERLGPGAAASGGKKSLLVVDDEEVIRDYFQKVLSDYRVMTAATGEEALVIVRHQRPDIILLDFRLPGVDGIQILKKIKKIDKSIAVVMLSAFGDSKICGQATKCGAYAFLPKPFDLLEMKKVLDEAVVKE